MDESDIWPLAPLTVVNMVSSLSQKCIVLDCRSFLSFNAAHIKGSLNVHCPPILKRRLHRGTSTLDCLLTSPESKRRLAEAETLILYEDRTQDWKDLEIDNTMKIIYMLLRRERINKNLYFIKGKFCSSIASLLFLQFGSVISIVKLATCLWPVDIALSLQRHLQMIALCRQKFQGINFKTSRSKREAYKRVCWFYLLFLASMKASVVINIR